MFECPASRTHVLCVWEAVAEQAPGAPCSVEEWWFDPNGKLLRRARAIKEVPYATPYQMALFDREAENLSCMSWRDEGGKQHNEVFAPIFFNAFTDQGGGSARKGRLVMRCVLFGALCLLCEPIFLFLSVILAFSCSMYKSSLPVAPSIRLLLQHVPCPLFTWFSFPARCT